MKPEPSLSKCANAAIRFSRRCSFPRKTVAVRNSCVHQHAWCESGDLQLRVPCMLTTQHRPCSCCGRACLVRCPDLEVERVVAVQVNVAHDALQLAVCNQGPLAPQPCGVVCNGGSEPPLQQKHDHCPVPVCCTQRTLAQLLKADGAAAI